MSEKFLYQRLTDEEKRQIADVIDAELRRKAAADGGFDLETALHNMDVVLSAMIGEADPRGAFTPAGWNASGNAIVSVHSRCTTYTRPSRVEVFAHELTHFLMSDWVAPHFYGADRVVIHGGEHELQADREDIARDVHSRWRVSEANLNSQQDNEEN